MAADETTGPGPRQIIGPDGPRRETLHRFAHAFPPAGGRARAENERTSPRAIASDGNGADKSGALAPLRFPGRRARHRAGFADRRRGWTGNASASVKHFPRCNASRRPRCRRARRGFSATSRPDLGMAERLGRAVIIVEPKRNLIHRRSSEGASHKRSQMQRRIHQKADRVGALGVSRFVAHVLVGPRSRAILIGEENRRRRPSRPPWRQLRRPRVKSDFWSLPGFRGR